ncbi:MAG TPA: thioesterase family protein [Solirubrobacteraceae bacterium]|nr:thioesterase family protein [Solirubrobacteraceae bacterium]
MAEAEAAPGERSAAAAADATPPLRPFDADTAVRELGRDGGGEQPLRAEFAAEVSPDWRAGRGPHGGYLAAILMRALIQTVADAERAPRSLTIHYARAPEPGPVSIVARIERAGRSLSTLSARMEQEGKLIALALAAFSVTWSAQEVLELPMPEVEPPDAVRDAAVSLVENAPPFTRHIVVQGRIGARPFKGSEAPMEVGAWLGLAEPRAIDAISLAFFSDALFSPPFIRLTEPSTTPTVDLTVHFRKPLAPVPTAVVGDAPPPHELCFARFRTGLIQDGFFEEDGVIWAEDGTVLAQSRQLGIVLRLNR